MPLGDCIAEVFLRPARTYSVHPTPGRRLSFYQGLAKVHTDAELDYCLNLPNASIRPTDRYKAHVALRISGRDELHPVAAEIDDDGLYPAADYPGVNDLREWSETERLRYLAVEPLPEQPPVETPSAASDESGVMVVQEAAADDEGFQPYGWFKEEEPVTAADVLEPKRGRPRRG